MVVPDPPQPQAVNIADFQRCPQCGNWHPKLMQCGMLPQLNPMEFTQRILNNSFEIEDLKRRIAVLESEKARREKADDDRRRQAGRPQADGPDKRSGHTIERAAYEAERTPLSIAQHPSLRRVED